MNRRRFLGVAAILSPVVAIAAKAVAAASPAKGNRVITFGVERNGVECGYELNGVQYMRSTPPASFFDVFDARTGKEVEACVHADESRGIIHVVRRDANGRFMTYPGTCRPIRDEIRRDIRILPKPYWAKTVNDWERMLASKRIA